MTKNKVQKICVCMLLCLISVKSVAGELLDLYNKALEINPTLLSRAYAIDQAIAREDQAFSTLLPQISLDGSYAFNRFHSQGEPTSRYQSTRATAQATQVLFDLPSYLRYQSSESATLQSKLERDSYLMQLSGDLIDRYLLILEASDLIVYLKEENLSVQSQINRLQKMLRRQMVTVTDLYEVEAYGHALNTQIIEAENEKNIALERIREITSVLPKSLPSLNIRKLPNIPVLVDQWIAAAISSNPAISALKAGLRSADKNIASAKAGHLPILSARLSQTYSDQGYENRESSAFDVGSATLQLNVPIFSGGRITAETREAIATRHLIFQEQEVIRREIERETRTSFLNTVSGKARIDSAKRQLDARRKATKALQKGYELGVSTIVDVLESKRALVQSQTELWQSRYQYIRDSVLLRMWAGSLNRDYMEQVDQWFSPN